MADSANPFTASFAKPWPLVPEYPPFANPLFIKYLCSPLAFHAAGPATPSSIGKEPVYPWIARSVHEPVKRNAAGIPQYQQAIGCYNVNAMVPSNESVTPGPLSPQPTPPTSLSPGKLFIATRITSLNRRFVNVLLV